MGMTVDFEDTIEEEATLARVGTAELMERSAPDACAGWRGWRRSAMPATGPVMVAALLMTIWGTQDAR